MLTIAGNTMCPSIVLPIDSRPIESLRHCLCLAMQKVRWTRPSYPVFSFAIDPIVWICICIYIHIDDFWELRLRSESCGISSRVVPLAPALLLSLFAEAYQLIHASSKSQMVEGELVTSMPWISRRHMSMVSLEAGF